MSSKKSMSKRSTVCRHLAERMFCTRKSGRGQRGSGIRPCLESLESRNLMAAMADFNGDGFGDLAVGAPFEDVPLQFGDAVSAGAVNVLYGSANGISAAGNQIWHLDLISSSGGIQANDQFGWALAAGDFNGDGRDDLAISAPGRSVGGDYDAGVVSVLYGSASGLTAGGNQTWSQDSPNIEGAAEPGDQFGYSLSAGDFNGDGRDDLAVGVPYENVGNIVNAGAVNILFGSVLGLRSSGDQIVYQNVPNPDGFIQPNGLDVAEANDQFGRVLSAGDFNADGRDDLVVGVPEEDIGNVANAGAVSVLYGSAGGVSTGDSQFWSQNTAGIADSCQDGDVFGHALAVGDFNADGKDDLAIGVPNEDFDSIANAGMVHVLYGNGASGLSSAGSQEWHQNRPGIENSYEANDMFGAALAVGDFNGDGADDLAVGVPGENSSAGAMHVLYGGDVGISSWNNMLWTQNNVGNQDASEVGDHFGASLAVGDFNGDGQVDLAIGVPDEGFDDYDSVGAVHVLYGTPFGLDDEDSQFLTQDAVIDGDPIAGLAEQVDSFGFSLGGGR